MPIYQYVCTECGEQLEVSQSFTDAALTECPACHGRLRKRFSSVGVVFKGSGFYRTDARGSNGATAGKASANGTSDKPAGSADATAAAETKRASESSTSGSTAAGSSAAGSTSAGSKAATTTAT